MGKIAMNAETKTVDLTTEQSSSLNTHSSTPAQVKKFRFYSVDILRGFVIILMALDHVRDFWGMTRFNVESLDDSNLAWFLTRWVTHFCAPIFVFLAGTSIYFQEHMGKSRPELVRFLLTRGLWLVLLELTVITLSWRLPVLPGTFTLQVIWILGICMILMAGLIYLPKPVLFVGAMVMIFGHNYFDDAVDLGSWWTFLHQGGLLKLEDIQVNLLVFYPLIPWPAVMVLGYLLGQVYLPANTKEPSEHKQWLTSTLTKLGIACLVAFVVLRIAGVYGDSTVFQAYDDWQVSIMSFLKVHKYPPSLHYLLVTLGGCLLLLALFEKVSNAATRFFLVFGRVPMFFYLLHIPLISLTAQLWTNWKFGDFYNLAMAQIIQQFPANYEPSLLRTYVVWASIIAVFYFACKAYDKFRSARPHQWWWRYL